MLKEKNMNIRIFLNLWPEKARWCGMNATDVSFPHGSY